MIDINCDTLIRLCEVPSWAETKLGQRVHRSTVHRWHLRGCRGVKLETLMVGGVRHTSHEALERYFAGVTAASETGESKSLESHFASRSHQRADKELKAEGL